MRVTTCSIAALIATAVVATGCGGDDDEKDTAGAQPSGATTVQNNGAPASDPDAKRGTTSPKDALGSRESQVDRIPVRLDITELRRSGATSSITIQLVQMGNADRSGAQLSDTLDDGISDAKTGNEYDTNDGISLIDTINRKRYLVARDSNGRCVCDNGLSGTFVRTAGPTVLSATFAAPPNDVKSVDVVIPRFGTFKNVPLS